MAQKHEDLLVMTQQINTLLHLLGFSINWGKSTLIPSQEIQFLGFVVNSVTMTMSLPEEKVKSNGISGDPKARESHSQRIIQDAWKDDSSITGSPPGSPVLSQSPASQELGVCQSPVLRGGDSS